MKILKFVIAGLLLSYSFTVAAQEKRETAKARKDVSSMEKDLVDARADLGMAKIDSAEDFRRFLRESEMKINDNKLKIGQLKKNRLKNFRYSKERYDREVLALEEKNDELQLKIKASAKTKTDVWFSFKREFNYDLFELEEAIKYLGRDKKDEY